MRTLRSSMVSMISSSVSPRPSMMEDLVYTPHDLAARRTSMDWMYPARESRTRLCTITHRPRSVANTTTALYSSRNNSGTRRALLEHRGVRLAVRAACL